LAARVRGLGVSGVESLPFGVVTFLFSDIEGSTELSRHHGVGYGDLRAEHRRLLREAFAHHGGHEADVPRPERPACLSKSVGLESLMQDAEVGGPKIA
jgi:class 3 adenylate cyclase